MNDQQKNQTPVSASALETEGVGQVTLPGVQLAAQRQARGWSVEHAASLLKFAPRQVLALEAGDYAALPEPAIVRGFVRAYARLLGLDANALVALLPQERAAYHASVMPQRMLSMPFSESSLPFQNHSRLPSASIAGGIALVVLVSAVFVIGRTDLSKEALQLAWLKSSAAGSVIAAVSERVTDIVTPSASQSPAKAAMPESAVTVSKSRNALQLTFREDSWVEILRHDRTPVISSLLKAGTTRSFEITEPVTLVVGNAAGVDASLRGAKLDLQTGRGSNVARLNLK